MDSPTTWHDALPEYLAHLRAAGRPETTVRLRRYQMCHLAAGVRRGPWTITGSELVAYVAAQDWSTETRRSNRTTIRDFYAWAVRAGLVEESPADALPAVREAPPSPHPASDDALEAALAGAPAREALAIRLASLMGLRRGEVVLVHSLDLERGRTGWTLVVHGKGNKDRVLPVPDALAVDLREACMAGGGFAFPGTIEGHMSADHMGVIVSRLLPPGTTMHHLRHRFATRAFAATGDLLSVQQLLGHASPVTTQRYVAVDDSTRRAVLLAAA